MTKLNNDKFLYKLKEKGNDEEKKNNADLKITIQLYKNYFILKTENNYENYFSFNSKKNIEIFERIKKGFFPLKLIKESKIKKKEYNNLYIIIEDYSKENFFYLDPNFETTEIIIKLINGKNIKKIFNPFHTINDIKNLIENETLFSSKDFTLIFGFPPKEISKEDYNKTIIELGLINSTLIQKKIS